MSTVALTEAAMTEAYPAVREWSGLLAYRITGKTAELFPAP